MDGVPDSIGWVILLAPIGLTGIPVVMLTRMARRRNSAWFGAAAFGAGPLWLVYTIISTLEMTTAYVRVGTGLRKTCLSPNSMNRP